MTVECIRSAGCRWADTAGMRVCVNQCYALYSQARSAQWAAEDDERTSRGVYLGCPVCKQEVRFTCWHDGHDHSSVELPLPAPPDDHDF
jgi:hypothetical protein